MTTKTMATTTAPPAPSRISFAEPRDSRSLSNGSSNGFDPSNPEDYYEDWNKTTSEKNSWAYRERRRSSKFSKTDIDMAIQSEERQSHARRAASSTLGIFQQGTDKNGNPIILSDDHHDDLEVDEVLLKEQISPKAMATVFPNYDGRRLSESSPNSDRKKGSILSLWKPGKDKDGNDHLHSGHEGEDWETAVSTNGSESAPNSPVIESRGDRRGSILSIWKQGKDRKGNAVIHSGEAHDPDEIATDENGAPLEQVTSATSSKGKAPEVDERVGSILSIWSQGKDKEGKGLILSGEEYDDDYVVPVEVAKVEVPRGQERRGSILSMWTEGRERDETERPGKVRLVNLEEDDD